MVMCYNSVDGLPSYVFNSFLVTDGRIYHISIFIESMKCFVVIASYRFLSINNTTRHRFSHTAFGRSNATSTAKAATATA